LIHFYKRYISEKEFLFGIVCCEGWCGDLKILPCLPLYPT